MIDALQRVVSQLEQLPPEEQAELAATMQHLLDKRKNHVLVYGPHTDEEFEALLTELDQATPEDVPAILARQPKRWVKQDESINAYLRLSQTDREVFRKARQEFVQC